MINWLLDIFASKDWTLHISRDGPIMRRRVKGGWETRPLTAEETAEAVEWQAIK